MSVSWDLQDQVTHSLHCCHSLAIWGGACIISIVPKPPCSVITITYTFSQPFYPPNSPMGRVCQVFQFLSTRFTLQTNQEEVTVKNSPNPHHPPDNSQESYITISIFHQGTASHNLIIPQSNSTCQPHRGQAYYCLLYFNHFFHRSICKLNVLSTQFTVQVPM